MSELVSFIEYQLLNFFRYAFLKFPPLVENSRSKLSFSMVMNLSCFGSIVKYFPNLKLSDCFSVLFMLSVTSVTGGTTLFSLFTIEVSCLEGVCLGGSGVLK